MKVNKKVVIFVVVVLVMLGLWKGCTSMANQELLKSVTLHELKKEDFTKLYQTRGVVVSKKEVRYPIEGMMLECFVNVGDVVKKEEALLSYASGNDTKKLLCEMEGVITEISESYVTIAQKEDIWIKVSLPSKFVEYVHENDAVQIYDTKGKVVKISSVANYQNAENYYDVYIEGDFSYSLHEEVECVFEVMEYEEVYKVPLEAVVTSGDKEYVILDSWLEHVTDFVAEDVVIVDVVGVDGDLVVISSDEDLRGSVCVLSDLSLSFIKEMLEMYV